MRIGKICPESLADQLKHLTADQLVYPAALVGQHHRGGTFLNETGPFYCLRALPPSGDSVDESETMFAIAILLVAETLVPGQEGAHGVGVRM